MALPYQYQLYLSLTICPMGMSDPKMAALGSTNSSDLERLRSGCSHLLRISRVSVYSALRAGPAYKQGKHQEYIDFLFLSRQSLQNKQCFHNQVP
jgi:hypothetical protein